MIFPDSSIVDGVVRASSFGRAALPLYGADRRVFAINLNHHPPPLPSRRHFQSILNYFMSPASMRLLLDDFVSPSALVRNLLLLLSSLVVESLSDYRQQPVESTINAIRSIIIQRGRVVIKTFFSAGNTGNIFHFQSNDNHWVGGRESGDGGEEKPTMQTLWQPLSSSSLTTHNNHPMAPLTEHLFI